MKKTRILGVEFHALTMPQAVKEAMSFFDGQGKPKMIVTPGTEIIMHAHRNPDFCKILNSADLSVADGIGAVMASRILKIPALPERVTGADLTANLLEQMQKSGHCAYFFGSKPGVAEKARKMMQKKYPNLCIVGARDGYFKDNDIDSIITEINAAAPDLLIVGLGSPKQERWIYDHLDKLNIRAAIGVGGVLDVFSGNIPRAPKFFLKTGTEWLYRLIKEPSRFRRQLQLYVFAVIIFRMRVFGK